jgi:signal transduction histidine kinase
MTEDKGMALRLTLPPGPVTLAADVEYNLLRIAQEAIANAVRHSGASLIEVMLESTPRQVRLVISDDGSGFDADEWERSPGGHYGLIGIKERAAQIGAEVRVESAAGNGTRIRVRLASGSGSRVPGVGTDPKPDTRNPRPERSAES